MQDFRVSYAHNCAVIYYVADWRDWSQLLNTIANYRQITADADPAPHLIYHFDKNVMVPQPWAIPNLRKFIDANACGKHRTIMVNAPRVLKVFMRMVQQVYADVWDDEETYIFVDTLEEACAVVGERANI